MAGMSAHARCDRTPELCRRDGLDDKRRYGGGHGRAGSIPGGDTGTAPTCDEEKESHLQVQQALDATKLAATQLAEYVSRLQSSMASSCLASSSRPMRTIIADQIPFDRPAW